MGNLSPPVAKNLRTDRHQSVIISVTSTNVPNLVPIELGGFAPKGRRFEQGCAFWGPQNKSLRFDHISPKSRFWGIFDETSNHLITMYRLQSADAKTARMLQRDSQIATHVGR